MEDAAKIRLSAEEAGLISNTEWILTKHSVVEKVYQLFGQVSELMKIELAPFAYLSGDIKYLNGKISKGENYKSLPYIILDYPANFGKNNIFSVRTMFWWGNFFSVTLHLSGEHKARFTGSDPQLLSFLKTRNFFVCINKEEWEHDFGENNYHPATELNASLFEKIIQQSFFKVAKKLPVNQWDNAAVFIMDTFRQIIELLRFSFQGGKKDLSPGSPTTGSGL